MVLRHEGEPAQCCGRRNVRTYEFGTRSGQWNKKPDGRKRKEVCKNPQ